MLKIVSSNNNFQCGKLCDLNKNEEFRFTLFSVCLLFFPNCIIYFIKEKNIKGYVIPELCDFSILNNKMRNLENYFFKHKKKNHFQCGKLCDLKV